MRYPQFEAHAAMEDRHWWFLARREILARLLRELLPPRAGKRLVDVGCGTGGLANFLGDDYDVLGVDPSDDAIAFAREKFPGRRFVRGSAPDDVRAEMREADGVLLIEVLEHVEHDLEFVRSIVESMKPGAVLAMIAPADPALWGPHDEAFEHYRRYDGVADLRRLWSGLPVEELLVSACNSRLYPVVKLMRALSRLRGASWGKGGTDIEVPNPLLNVLLRRIFAGESARLLRALKTGKGAYRRGVSVLAILKKSP